MSKFSGQTISKHARASRTDGAETRARIIETAGGLFASQGYGNTTSKSICEHAKVNMAAINYHFGSREGLYLTLLQEVHRHLMSMEFLSRIADSGMEPQHKFARLIDELVHHVMDSRSWHTRLWAREILDPSPLLEIVMRDEAMPKFGILSGIISEMTGIPVNDPALIRCTLNVIAPCLMLLFINRDLVSPLLTIFDHPETELAEHLKTYARAGMQAIARAQPGRQR